MLEILQYIFPSKSDKIKWVQVMHTRNAVHEPAGKMTSEVQHVNSLTLGRCGSNFKDVISKHILQFK